MVMEDKKHQNILNTDVKLSKNKKIRNYGKILTTKMYLKKM